MNEVETAAESVRARLAPLPEPGQFKSPDEMIVDLEVAKWGAGRIALVLKDALGEVKSSRRSFAAAHARALKSSDGKSAEQREADAVLACEGEQLALDVAEAAYEFARMVARSVEQAASMTQTQAGLVRAQMQLAGTREP